MDNLQRIRDTSISTTIPCPDSQSSYQWTRAALTPSYINRRRMAMENFQRIRETPISTTIPCPDSQPSYESIVSRFAVTIPYTLENWDWRPTSISKYERVRHLSINSVTVCSDNPLCCFVAIISMDERCQVHLHAKSSVEDPMARVRKNIHCRNNSLFLPD